MNPLTLVKRTQKITAREAALGISEEASWHAKYKDSAYIFVGGIPFDLTEGDLLAVFAQYGEIVDVNLVRDKGTGKSKGFAFIAYEDQRSTILAVDNLNGAQILGRIIRVDHCSKYKKKEEEDEEAERQKREARGVCRAFQRGECTRGAGCKFSHDEQRAANTGWGPQDRDSRWGHDKFEDSRKVDKRAGNSLPNRALEPRVQEELKSSDHDLGSRGKGNERLTSYDQSRRDEKRSRYNDNEEQYEQKSRDERDKREDKRLSRRDDYGYEKRSREDRDRREEKTSKRNDYPELERRDGDYDKREERREDPYWREYKRSRRHDDPERDPKAREDRDRSMRHDDAAVERRDGEGPNKREERRSLKHNDDIKESRRKKGE